MDGTTIGRDIGNRFGKTKDYADARSGGAAGCSICTRAFSRSEARVVLPSAAYGAIALPIARRLACVGCYKGLLKVNKAAATRAPGDHSIKRARQHLARRMMQNTRP